MTPNSPQSRHVRPIRTCSLIGTGIAARAIGPRLVGAGVSVVAVAGRDLGRTAQLAEAAQARPSTVVSIQLDVDLVVLAVSDSAVPGVASELANRGFATDAVVCHLAGALRPSVLPENFRRGKMHPLASLAGGPRCLEGVVWGIEGDADVAEELADLTTRMGGLPVDVSNTDLTRYHLAAVYASNFLLGLMNQASQLWAESGAPIPAAEALIPLARTVLANWELVGLPNALTGPIARGDVTAVAAQLQTAANRGRVEETFFRALSMAVVDVAAARDGDAHDVAEIARLLSEDTVLN